MKNTILFLAKYRYLIIGISFLIALLAWDWLETSSTNTESGTYRAESEFDAVTGASTIVAVVPSDYDELPYPVSRSTELNDSLIEDMVAEAIELQGGLEGVVSKGDKVLIKPNLVGANEPAGTGENTDYRVVKALIKILNIYTEGEIEIIIAEGTARANDDPTVAGSVWHNSGYVSLLTDPEIIGINVSLVNLNQTINDLVEIDLMDKATAAPHEGKYKVNKAIFEADVYIVVPVLKIHNTGITCALKNQIGTAPGCYYGYNKMAGSEYYTGLVHDENQRRWTEEEIVDLSNIAGIDFVVVDATTILESYKTDNGSNRVQFNAVIAGADPVAVDHVCTKLLCLNPDDINHITLSEKIGLGTNNPEKIWIKGASIAEAKIKVKKNTEPNGTFGQSNRTWIISPAFKGTSIVTEYIENEATLVPEQQKNGWSEPIYFFDDRIDLYSYFNESDSIVTYAFSNFYAPEQQTAELWVGSDEAMWVYLNGEKVYNFSSMTSFGDADLLTDVVDINIKEGKNTLLVKTYQRYGDYSFTLNICEPENTNEYAGNRVSGLYFYQDTVKTPVDPVNIFNTTFKESKLTVYPNPCTDWVLITLKPDYTSKTIKIYNLNGQLVKSFSVNSKSLQEERIIWNLESEKGQKIPSGQYIVTDALNRNSVRLIIN